MATLIFRSLDYDFSQYFSFRGVLHLCPAIIWAINANPPCFALGLSCVLAGQSFGVNERKIQTWKRRAYNLVAVTWLLSAVLISAMFSSNHIAPPVYKTKWTKLEQLENFSLYFGFEKDSGTHDMHLYNMTGLVLHRKGYYGLRGNATTGRYSFHCPENSRLGKRSACTTFVDQLGTLLTHATKVKGHQKYVQWWHRYRTLLLNMVMRAEFYDLAKSEETILENIGGPKTVVVTPLECVDQDWAAFQKVTAETGTQFGNNLHVDDGLFRKPRFYMASDRMGKEHGSILHKRLRGIIQSGIHGFWKKWDKFKDEMAVKRGKQKHEEPETLAFENSEIGGPFYAFGIGMALSVAGFLFEIVLEVAGFWNH